MNAARPDNLQSAHQGSMKGALIKSSIFHGLVITIALVGIPFVKTEPLIVAPVSVELVDISELSQTDQKPSPKPKPIPTPEEPKKIEPPKPPEEELKKPEAQPEPKKPDPVPLPKPEESKKQPEKPKPKPKEKPKPKPKKEEPKQDDLFNSLLKDLTPTEEEDQNKQNSKNPDLEDGQTAPIANQISMSELDALRRQIEPCWNVPSGAKYAENLVVTLRLSMNRDMTVRDVRVINGGLNPDPAFRAAADSAVRAVRNPRCSPFQLPPEKYEQWKTITINFDPSDML
ncbi:MAG TPA: cell envelope integrity protein TolA [Alphaproteobacteria bacterium]|nr:cell envelope integrity protein TolA [Alphaproteobacteria bacterium]USO06250.1 MAG: cell envelope integrity protein TolA [Rhodospirillales bacterium]HOO81454.1 cell envelope integrity protein TolA [Alphaproteobacteria bacterium]